MKKPIMLKMVCILSYILESRYLTGKYGLACPYCLTEPKITFSVFALFIVF